MKIQTIILIINRLIISYFNFKDRRVLVFGTLNIIGKMLKDNGFLFTVKYIKQARLHITRYISGKPLMVNDKGVSLINGFPKKFIVLKQLADGNFVEKKVLLSILNFTKAIPTPKEAIIPDYSTITNPCKTKGYIIPDSFTKVFIERFNLKCTDPTYFKEDYYLSSKIGPQGPSLPMSIQTTACLSIEHWRAIREIMGQYKDLFSKFFLVCITKGSDLPSWTSNKGPTGKIALLDAPEGKTRIIAMIDYYSQFCLKAIHDKLFKKLINFPCDRTFTQDPWGISIRGTNSFHSLDLSAATDRLPISLQERLLSFIFNKNLAKYWGILLRDREYILPTGEPIKYKVGTPMGSYTSWAMLAITHHYIICWAWYTSYGVFPESTEYIVLGDDVVITNDKVARKYKYIMRRLGVDISPHKTHVSFDTYEFAKRWIHKGQEITGLPLTGLIANFRNPVILYTVLQDFISKGNCYLFSGGLLDLLIVLYKDIKWYRGNKLLHISSNYLRNKVNLYILALRFSSGLATYDEIRKYIAYYARNNSYIIANGRVGLSELQRLLTQEVEAEAIKASNQSAKVVSDARKYVNQISVLTLLPAFQAANNRLAQINKVLEDFRSLRITLQVAVRQLILFDFNQAVAWDRNNAISAIKAGKIFKKVMVSFKNAESFSTFDDNAQGRFSIFSKASLDDKFKSLKWESAGPPRKSILSRLK